MLAVGKVYAVLKYPCRAMKFSVRSRFSFWSEQIVRFLANFRKRIIDNFAHRPALKRVLVRAYIIRELDRKGRRRVLGGFTLFGLALLSFIYAHFSSSGSQAVISLPSIKIAKRSLINATIHDLFVAIGFFFFLLSVFSLLRSAFGLLKEVALVGGTDDEKEITYRSVYDTIAPKIVSDETESFEIARLANGDLISRSNELDQYLVRRPLISLSVGKAPIHFYRQTLSSKILSGLGMRLMERATKSDDTYFFNEQKVSLQTDLVPNAPSARIAQTTYFATQISNYACRFAGFDEQNLVRYNFSTLFPIYEGRLLPLARSILSNQIGVSTLCLDVDGHPFLVLQGSRVFSNPDTLAPTGSGSMDWDDWLRLKRTGAQQDLLSLVNSATTREFAEENSVEVNDLKGFSNLVIGYFRYIENGGLPEFVSISRIGVSFKHLRPDVREIQSILAYKRISSEADILAFCAEIDSERQFQKDTDDEVVREIDPKKKRVSLPLRALCSRLASIVNGDLGQDAKNTILDFWNIKSSKH